MVLAFLHPLALPIGPTSGAQEACRDSCRGQARFATCRGFSRCILGLDGITHSFETFDTPEGYVIYFDATGKLMAGFACPVTSSKIDSIKSTAADARPVVAFAL